AQAVAQQRTDANGGLDAAVLAFAGFGDAQVDRVVPVRAFLFQPGDQEPVAFDHHLGVAGLHRELEVVEAVRAGNAGELQRALDPLRGFHRGLGLEVDVGDDGDVAVAGTELANDALQVGRVLHRRGGDADDLAADGHEVERLLYARGGVHRVAGEHRLDDDRMAAADDDAAAGGITDDDFARVAAAEEERRFAVAHALLG